eukprot:Colp12_sorted_trinity150504_noHs@8725
MRVVKNNNNMSANKKPKAASVGQMKKSSSPPRWESDDKRVMHNIMERKRRMDLKGHMDRLRDCIPILDTFGKTSSISILQKGLQYIHMLKTQKQDLDGEQKTLEEENHHLRQRLMHIQRMVSEQRGSMHMQPHHSAGMMPPHHRDSHTQYMTARGPVPGGPPHMGHMMRMHKADEIDPRYAQEHMAAQVRQSPMHQPMQPYHQQHVPHHYGPVMPSPSYDSPMAQIPASHVPRNYPPNFPSKPIRDSSTVSSPITQSSEINSPHPLTPTLSQGQAPVMPSGIASGPPSLKQEDDYNEHLMSELVQPIKQQTPPAVKTVYESPAEVFTSKRASAPTQIRESVEAEQQLTSQIVRVTSAPQAKLVEFAPQAK